MLLKPKILLYIITVAVLIAAAVWEYYMQQWLSYQPNGGEAVMRTDLFVIWPVVLTLVAISGFRLFFDKRK
jgi:small-conductance mechanosensitive channel